MKSQLLVTAIGEDRPGIVARLTEVFVKHNGNVEESRMALLGGEFAAIILVAIPSERVDGLKKELDNLRDETISVSVKATSAHDPKRFAGHSHFEINLTGADHEGIVHKVSAWLRDRAINILSMSTEVVSAPVSGTPLFCMNAVVVVPSSLTETELRSEMNKIGSQENVEIKVAAYKESTKHEATAIHS
jgi:glycine cleavage system transcriptional repressor